MAVAGGKVVSWESKGRYFLECKFKSNMLP